MIRTARAGLAAWLMPVLSLAAHSAPSHSAEPSPNAEASRLLAEARARQPLGFEANQGQAAPGIAFVAHASGYQAALRNDGSLVQWVAGSAASSRMTLLGALAGEPVTGHRLPVTTTHPSGDVPSYERVTYRHVYPGIDATYHGHAGAVEYDFEVAPGADPAQIRLSFRDAQRLTLDAASGDLLATDRRGEVIRHSRPEIYQEQGSDRQAIAGGYRLLSPHVVAFEAGSYDHSRRLIIDPTISITRFLYGNSNEQAFAMTTDAAGNTYIGGLTSSTVGFPTGAATPVVIGRKDCTLLAKYTQACNTSAYVVKLDPAGNIAATVLFGGLGYTVPRALAVDGSYVYVAGGTNSPSMTLASGKPAVVTYNYGGQPKTQMRAFLAKFSPQLSSLNEVTTLGSACVNDPTETSLCSAVAQGLFVDSTGSAYLAGWVSGPGYPTTPSAFQSKYSGQGTDIFVTRLDYFGTLSSLYGPVFSTRFGGLSDDAATAITVNAAGSVWLTGYTYSYGFPTTPGLSHGTAGTDGSDISSVFLTELDPSGSTYLYSITFRGNQDPGSMYAVVRDKGLSLALDDANGVYVGGLTTSSSFYTVQAPGHPPVQAHSALRSESDGLAPLRHRRVRYVRGRWLQHQILDLPRRDLCIAGEWPGAEFEGRGVCRRHHCHEHRGIPRRCDAGAQPVGWLRLPSSRVPSTPQAGPS